ncbi:hypothetical protein Ciccas_009709 [Cichlidogyrus casuarinus]|uniref:Uncharacterized protein n=1 Tax=Cichlidogyrus casuarinus TaxID=1844966 RepID=A0ABD2PW81_9PLAT
MLLNPLETRDSFHRFQLGVHRLALYMATNNPRKDHVKLLLQSLLGDSTHCSFGKQINPHYMLKCFRQCTQYIRGDLDFAIQWLDTINCCAIACHYARELTSRQV